MMETDSHYDAVCLAMSEPAFYPHPVAGPERRDTHISTVFLTGDRAYKIKKPVNLGFVDFRYLSDRYYYCRQEVQLNRRLSCGVYHYVRPVYSSSDGKVSFKPIGPIVEYVVCMRELPESVRLDVMLHKNQIRKADIELLGGRLADFYRTCNRSGNISKYGELNTIRTNIEENFSQLAPFAKNMFDPDPWVFICQASRTVMDQRSELFAHRVRSGAICDGHGDLRCEHIYLDNGLQIIDCIEFNDRFRYGDVALDLAFLKMDLDYRQQSRHGSAIIDAYVENSADLGIYSLIDFYAAYRAIVRLKIVCLQSASNNACLPSRALQRADRYLDLAYCYAWRFSRPTLWICCGLPATGKSRLARCLSETYRIEMLSTDLIRNKMYGTAEGSTKRFGQGIYHVSQRTRIYRQMMADAQQVLRNGRSVVLDATFSRAGWRDAVFQLARDCDTSLIVAECVCSVKTMRKRLRRRDTKPSISGARLEHLSYMLENYQSLDDLQDDIHVRVQTEYPAEQTVRRFLAKAYQALEKQLQRRMQGQRPIFFAEHLKPIGVRRTQDAE